MEEENDTYVFNGIAATTHLNLQGKRLTIEDLKQIEKTFKSNPFLYNEHDTSAPPVAKIIYSKLRKHQDGEWEVYVRGETQNTEMIERMKKASRGEATLGFSPGFFSKEADPGKKEQIQIALDKGFSEQEFVTLKDKFEQEKISIVRYEKFSLEIADPEVCIELGVTLSVVGGILVLAVKPIYDEACKDVYKFLKEVLRTKGNTTITYILQTEEGKINIVYKGFREKDFLLETQNLLKGCEIPLKNLPEEHLKNFERLTIERTEEGYVPCFLNTRKNTFSFKDGEWKKTV